MELLRRIIMPIQNALIFWCSRTCFVPVTCCAQNRITYPLLSRKLLLSFLLSFLELPLPVQRSDSASGFLDVGPLLACASRQPELWLLSLGQWPIYSSASTCRQGWRAASFPVSSEETGRVMLQTSRAAFWFKTYT